MDDGSVAAGFHIGLGFSDAVETAQPSTITVVGDAGSPVATEVASGSSPYVSRAQVRPQVEVRWRNSFKAVGTATSRMPVHQATASHALEPMGVPSSRPRAVSVIGVTG